MKDEASYVCESCGEEIVVSIDLSAGSGQVEIDDQGDVIDKGIRRQLCASIRRSFSPAFVTSC